MRKRKDDAYDEEVIGMFFVFSFLHNNDVKKKKGDMMMDRETLIRQRILLKLHVCMLLVVTYLTLNAYVATEPLSKAFYIFTSLMFGGGVAWIHFLARRRHAQKED